MYMYMYTVHVSYIFGLLLILKSSTKITIHPFLTATNTDWMNFVSYMLLTDAF